MIILKMAWRNVWRNSRRSSITIAAMTLALFVELLYAGMVAGLVYGMEEDATAYELGDVQVFSEGYLTKPSLYDAVEDDEAIVSRLREAGFRATGRLYSGGLGAAGELSSGVALVGIDPEGDAATMELHAAIGEGEWLDAADPKGIVIGRGLARTLALGLGDELIVLGQASDGSVANEVYKVRGILMSVAAGLDRGGVLLTEGEFRELMVFPTGSHKIFVRKPVEQPLDLARDEIAALVGARDGVSVKTWKEVSPFLAQYIDSVAGVIVVVYLIVYLAVGILILNAMLMAVFERIREFGVLKAIGYGPGQVLGMMVAEGMLQAVVATALGVTLALPVGWYLQEVGVNVGTLGGMQMAGMTMPPVWNAYYTLETTRVPVIMLFVIVLGAVIYPAVKAAWISPVEAMHHR
ncbi:MAG: ABC transporter permease [Deltaproteobacteria bacterium]|nr:MAG: ABC transporter permease [Deltaproteobacteria bacterium]